MEQSYVKALSHVSHLSPLLTGDTGQEGVFRAYVLSYFSCVTSRLSGLWEWEVEGREKGQFQGRGGLVEKRTVLLMATKVFFTTTAVALYPS